MVRLTKAQRGALFQVFQRGSLCDNCLEDRAVKAREESRGLARPSDIIGAMASRALLKKSAKFAEPKR
jgi:hypothetical protein